MSLVVFVNGLEDFFADSVGVLGVEEGFKVPEVKEVSMADSDEGVDDHEEHGFDGFGVGVDGSCELDDDFVGVMGNEDSEEVAEAHAGDEESGVDGILNHFGLILENPVVNLAEIDVHNMFKTLSKELTVYVGIGAAVNFPERFCGGVNHKVKQVAFFLN